MINKYASTLLNSTRMAGIQILIYKSIPKAVVFYEKRNSVIAFNRRLKFSSRQIHRQRIKYIVLCSGWSDGRLQV